MPSRALRSDSLLLGLATLAVLWGATALFGTVQVRRDILSDMRGNAVSSKGRKAEFYARAVALAPLVVSVEYGWVTRPIGGSGATEWHLWLFGPHMRLRTLRAWIS
jgi:hypothetical protein